MGDPFESFAAVLGDVYAELQWSALGDVYCHSGGENFFNPEAVDAMQDAGLLIVSDLAERLAPLEPPTSLYVGTGVAELVPMLFEALVLQRKVVAVTLPGPEPDEINRVLSAIKGPLPTLDTRPLRSPLEPQCSHLWFSSVITDPDAFPALHDRLYKRQGTHAAVGGGNLTKETRRAEELVIVALSWLCTPAVITTSHEELPFFEEILRDTSRTLKVPMQGRLSPVVGDALLHCDLV